MIYIIILFLFCLGLAGLIVACFAYTHSRKKPSSQTMKDTNLVYSNLVNTPLFRSAANTYQISELGYVYITSISNLPPNCTVQLSFNDLQVNLPVDSSGVAYPGGMKGQPLILSLIPYSPAVLSIPPAAKWDGIPMGTFSKWKITDLLPSNLTKNFQMKSVNSKNICNYTKANFQILNATMRNGAIDLKEDFSKY